MGVTVINPFVFSGFDPLSLSPALWLDASDAATITSSGGKVSEWRDKSTNGYKAVQATSSAQPTTNSVTQNGLNVLSFDGGDSMTITTVDLTPGGQKWSAWAVFNTARVGTASHILIEQTTNHNNNPGAFVVFFRNGTSGAAGPQSYVASRKGQQPPPTDLYTIIDSPPNQTDAQHVWIVTNDGTLSTNEINGWVDGTASTIRVFNNDTNVNNLNSVLYIGSRAGSSLFINGGVCEIGLVAGVITTQQRTDLQTYLKAKWGTP